MIRQIQANVAGRTVLLLLSEVLLIGAAFGAAAFVSVGKDELGLQLLYEQGFAKIAAVAAVCLCCTYFYDLYDSLVVWRVREISTHLLQVLGASCLVLGALYAVYPVIRVEWVVLVTGVPVAAAVMTGWRSLFAALADPARSSPAVAAIQEGPLAAFARRLATRPQQRAASLVFSMLGLALSLPAIAPVAVVEAVFWVAVFLLFYTWLFYPFVLFVAYCAAQFRRDFAFLWTRRDRRVMRAGAASAELPFLSMIIPAHNEERELAGKLANLSELDYPSDRLQIVFVSDGSTDATNEMLASVDQPNVESVFLPSRAGKALALNEGVARARGDILVFCDAATLVDSRALRNMARHFADPAVGVVCATIRFQRNEESEGTEGLYWKYECMLRLMEGRLGATLTASGALYAVRRSCYRALGRDAVIDDFLVPAHARRLGYRVLYDPEVEAFDVASATVAGEFHRRTRLAVGSFSAMGELLRSGWRGFSALAFFSHKLLRWSLPFLLLVIGGCTLALRGKPFYGGLFVMQAVFCGWAAVGFLLRNRARVARYVLAPYFLAAMSLAFLVGFARYLSGREEAKWQRVS